MKYLKISIGVAINKIPKIRIPLSVSFNLIHVYQYLDSFVKKKVLG